MGSAISVPLTPDVHARRFSRRLSTRATFALLARSSFRFWPGPARPPRSTRCIRPNGASRHHDDRRFRRVLMAVLFALLTVGSLSDYVGRRPVLLVASRCKR